MNKNKLIIGLYFIMVLALSSCSKEIVYVYHTENCSDVERSAANELCKYLPTIYPEVEFTCTDNQQEASVIIGKYVNLVKEFSLSHVKEPADGGYVVVSRNEGKGTKNYIVGSSPRSTLDAVYALLEKLGYGFYLTHDTKPLQKGKIDYTEWEIENQPVYKDRIVFNWHNFLSGCTSWNFPDWQSWIYQSSKMGFNTIMVHAYANNPMYQFDMNGQVKPVGYMNTSISGRDWGAQHVNDVRLLPGGDLFDSAVFGADVAQVADEERSKAATGLMQQVFKEAKSKGMNVILAIDTDTKEANPQNIIMTLPESARFKAHDAWLATPDTPEGYAYYKELVKDILTTYPEINKLALWTRGGGTSWTALKPSNLPSNWQGEYASFIKKHKDLADNAIICGYFALSKMVQAYQKALKDNGREDVEVMIGSWRWNPSVVANYVMPSDVAFIPLDYAYVLNTPETKELLTKIGKKRKLLPVIWAQHDDHRFMGRSYRPYENFSDLLKENKAQGFGIIHWTNVPHDLFFKNIIKQVWKNTENINHKETIKNFVADHWKNNSPTLNKYFTKWATEAPMFGMETYDVFFGPYVYSRIKGEFGPCDSIIAKCTDRLELLNSLSTEEVKCDTNLVEYMKTTERYYIKLFQNHKYVDAAYKALEDHRVDEAKEAILQTNAVDVVCTYAEALKYGYKTRGELGLLYSMGSRYYPFYEHLKQLVGINPVRIKFRKTNHDVLAQGVFGAHTWFVDGKRTLFAVKGTYEIGKNVAETPEYISFKDDVDFAIEPFYKVGLLEKSFDLSAGDYEIALNFLGNEVSNVDFFYLPDGKKAQKLTCISQTEGQHTIVKVKVSLKEDANAKLRISPKTTVKMDEMVITKVK